MSMLHESEVRERARRFIRENDRSAESLLREASTRDNTHYDIFLSQTIRDAEIVLGVFVVLRDAGYKVFCDWIAHPDCDRSAVTPANAETIRTTMKLCDTLLFLDTAQANHSLWMCWELGWFDGHRGPVAILPVLPDGEKHYRGREFLGIYPYAEIDENGKIRIVRPVVPSPFGISIIEAPNKRSFDNWRKRDGDKMRPRVPGLPKFER